MLRIKPPKFQISMKILNKVTWLYLFLMFIWIFVALIMPAAANVGGSSGSMVNAFYNSYSNQDDIWTGLSPVGIATVVFFTACLFWTVGFLIFYTIRQIRCQTKLTWRHAVWYTDFATLFLLSLIFFIIAMVPPFVGQLAQNWHLYNEIQTVNQEWNQQVNAEHLNGPLSSQLQALIIQTAQSLSGSNAIDGISIQNLGSKTPISTWASLVNAINNYQITVGIIHLTPLWDAKDTIIWHSNGWTGIVSIFSIVLILLFLVPTTAWMVVYLKQQDLKSYRTMAKEMMKNYRSAMSERRSERKKKRDLMAKEDQLWSSLEEMDSVNNGDTAIEKMSQYELEQKIAKTNELREEIELLKQQREELQTHRQKKKTTSYRQPTRNKKQKIAVPDQELEDIFKSLDL